MDTRIHNLLFLLSMAPLSIGCSSDDTGDTTTGASSTSPTTTSTSGSSGSSGEASSSGTTADTEATSTTADPSATATSTTGETSTSTTTGGVEGVPECVAYGAKNAECYMDEMIGDLAATYCNEAAAAYASYGDACVDAFVDYIACLSALTCREFTGADPICVDENAAFEAACP